MQASEEIMRIYERNFATEFKTDGSPVTEADLASSEIIRKILSETNVPLTGEEQLKEPYHVRKNWKRNWCVDPLDGTKEFIKRNGEFSVNIALIEDNRPVFGVLASPVKRELIYGGKANGVFHAAFGQVNDLQLHRVLEAPETPNAPLIFCSSRAPHPTKALILIRELRERFGEVGFLKRGSALKFMDLALNRADIYARYAPTMEWDIAAGQAILEGLGGSVCHAETGLPLYYNKENLFNPYFVARTQPLLDYPMHD